MHIQLQKPYFKEGINKQDLKQTSFDSSLSNFTSSSSFSHLSDLSDSELFEFISKIEKIYEKNAPSIENWFSKQPEGIENMGFF